MTYAVSLRDYQQAAFDKARDAVRAGHRRILICAPTGAGKCLGIDTPVLMYDGTIKPVQEVRQGDMLMGPDSRPRRVLSTTHGIGPLYRVTPTKGDAYVVNDAHILSLKMTRGATKWDCSRSDTYEAGKIHNITVLDYLSRSATFRHCAKGWRTGVEFESQPDQLPLSPYFIGLWLGDGLSRSASICTADAEVQAEVEAVARLHGLKTRIERQPGNRSVVVHINTGQRGGAAASRPVNHVQLKLEGLGLIGNKHIPHPYLTASRQDRLDLLAGLIDTDGSLSRGGFDFIQKSEHLARQVAFLARSLGLAAYVAQSHKTCVNNGVKGIYWRVSISGDCSVVPVRLPRKKASPRVMLKDPLLVGLSVEPIGEGDYFGFEIDGDRLFMLGDFTVTHNTVIGSALMEMVRSKGNRASFVVDRLSLIDQTSATFDRYGLDHGVIQGGHPRFRPSMALQLCSVQTLGRRQWPESSVDIFDEAHVLHKTHKARMDQGASIVIGLTATPFSKGLGKYFDVVINVTTTRKLIEDGWLVPYRVFACQEPDMSGVTVKSTGEWDEKEASGKALEVVGDVVAEYLKHGENRKFICSAVDTAHVEELQRQFLRAGINVATYTYKDSEDDRADVTNEFRKPDSAIRGLITVTAASRGFDIPDVGCVIMARPLRKSLAEHIQLFGRGLRISPETGKVDCLVLDHSGNMARFWQDCEEFFDLGVLELDDGKPKKDAKKKEKKEPEPVKCPSCRTLHKPMPHCPSCGHTYPKKQTVQHVPGTLKELIAGGHRSLLDRDVWPQVCGYALQATDGDSIRARKRALAIYKSMTGGWPSREFERTKPMSPTKEVMSRIRAQQIAFRKATQGARA